MTPVPDLSIVYVTYRPEPRFEWFADSLAAQLGDEACEVLCVDGLHSPARASQLRDTVDGRFSFRHVPAKPSPYSGPHRVTATDFHAPASARNTGIALARGTYLVFVDDSSVLMPGWWSEVKEAARYGYVVAGAYHFAWEMVVENGRLIDSRIDPFRRNRDEPYGIDTRWDIGDDRALVQCRGDQLYGGNFGAPRALLLAVNGNDELCDPMRGQDYHLGLRLEWSGARIFYSRRMLLIKSEERHTEGNTLVRRLTKTLEPAAYMRKLAEFGVHSRKSDGPWDSRHLVLDILHGTRAIRSIGNPYDLRDEPDLASTKHFPVVHWVDDQPLSEM